MLNIPAYTAPPPPPQPINGALQPTLAVGIAIPKVNSEETMCACEETKNANLWLILIGLAIGFVLFSRGK